MPIRLRSPSAILSIALMPFAVETAATFEGGPTPHAVAPISQPQIAVAESAFASGMRKLAPPALRQSELNERPALLEAESLFTQQLIAVGDGPDPLGLVSSMWFDILASTQFALGPSRWGEALANARRAVEIQERGLDRNDSRRLSSLVTAGRAAIGLGELGLARIYAEESVRLARAQPKRDEVALGRAINLLGRSRENDGLLADALVSYDEAARLLRIQPIRDTLGLFNAWNDSALLSARLKDYEGARETYALASALLAADTLRWYRQAQKIDANLGIVDAESGHLPEARSRFEHRLAMAERETGPHSLETAKWVNNLSLFELNSGNPQRSRALGLRALGVRRKIADWGGIVESLGNLALTWEALAVPDSTIACADAAISKASERWSRDNVGFIQSLLSRSRANLAKGDPRGAFDSAARAESLGLEQLDLYLKLAAERQGLEFALQRESGLDLLITAAEMARDSSRILGAWDALLRSRTLVLDEMAFRQQFLASADSAGTRVLRDRLQHAREALFTALRTDVGSPRTQGTGVVAARRALEEAERELAGMSGLFRRERAYARRGIREVMRALPRDARLIAFSRYLRFQPVNTEALIDGVTMPGASLDTTACYAAFVLEGANQAVQEISLGRASEIDSLVSAWRRAAGSPPPSSARAAPAEEECRQAGRALRRRIWDSLPAPSNPLTRTFVVPDGSLLLVNFAALPAARDSFLAETGPLIHTLSAERDLTREAESGPLGGTLLAMGDPTFPSSRGRSGAAPGSVSTSAVARGADRCFDPATAEFPSLPGSAAEAREVATRWRTSAGLRGRTTRASRLYLGRDASKAKFLEMAPRCRVIHLATHAYSISEDCTTYVAHPDGEGSTATRSAVVRSELPLLRSGIVLAAAGGSSDTGSRHLDGGDFVVTAQEIAGVDFSGVDWAVVSACDGGLGAYRAGEGLFGLRRAFQIAGAHTTIMALWKVDDEATRAWMNELYRARVTDALPTAEAMRAADRRILRARRVRGLSVHPAYWAGFLAAGDWR